MPEIGDIKPTPPTWGRRPVDRAGPEPRRPRPPVREQPQPKDAGDDEGADGKDDSRGGQIDEYA